MEVGQLDAMSYHRQAFTGKPFGFVGDSHSIAFLIRLQVLFFKKIQFVKFAQKQKKPRLLIDRKAW